MRLKLLPIIILLLTWGSTIWGQDASCLEDFDNVESLPPPTREESSRRIVAWYKNCIFVSVDDSLWLYDPAQPHSPHLVAHVENIFINNLAVSPVDSTIAFSVVQEPVVNFFRSNGMPSSIPVDKPLITAISFSSDGNLLAVASSDTLGSEGASYDAHVQIFNSTGEALTTIVPDAALVSDVFFSSDNRHVLIHEVEPGYLGDEVAIWDVDTGSQLWSYDAVLHKTSNFDDVLVFSSITIQGNIMALGGLYGFYNYNNFYGLGVHLWNVETQERLLKINDISGQSNWESAYEVPNLLLAFNTSGSVLATSTGDENIQLWDTHDGSQIGDIRVKASHIQQMTYGPDHLLAVMTEAGITIIDTESMSQITSFNLFKTP